MALSNGWCNMRWLNGVVIDRRHNAVQIELATGRKVWATPDFHVEMRENVLISWDYTNDCIATLTTQKRLDSAETEQEKVEALESEAFRSPSCDEFEGDVSDIVETSSGEPTEDESNVSEERSFPIPLDEDVDRDDVVLLRDDIHII